MLTCSSAASNDPGWVPNQCHNLAHTVKCDGYSQTEKCMQKAVTGAGSVILAAALVNHLQQCCSIVARQLRFM